MTINAWLLFELTIVAWGAIIIANQTKAWISPSSPVMAKGNQAALPTKQVKTLQYKRKNGSCTYPPRNPRLEGTNLTGPFNRTLESPSVAETTDVTNDKRNFALKKSPSPPSMHTAIKERCVWGTLSIKGSEIRQNINVINMQLKPYYLLTHMGEVPI